MDGVGVRTIVVAVGRNLIGRVWVQPEYRRFLLLMVLTSLATSSGTPLLSLYLVRYVGVSLSAAGLFFASLALVGLVLGVVLGRRSDHWSTRIPFLRVAAGWVAAGWLVLTVSPFPWLTLSSGALFLSLGGAFMGQAFATLHDVMVRDHEAKPELINTTVRTGWSFGFVFGPLLGSFLAATVNIRAAFGVAATLYLLCLLLLRGLEIATPARSGQKAQSGAASRPNFLLLAFTAACALEISCQTIKSTYLPIDVTMHLGASITTYGTIVSLSPVVELIVMPLAGLLAQKIAISSLITIGLAIGTVEYVILATSTMLWQLYVTQAMDACVVAVVMGLGVTYAQRLSPQHAGTANSIFFASFNVAYVVGGSIGSASVPWLGVPRVFLVPIALSACSLLVFQAVQRGARRHAASGLPVAAADGTAATSW
jgi:SET family sugar efflux transporter-like MFS transporter